MAKEKDPAFLFYPKDWLQGTAQMTAEEKGVYIDLLCHQHQENGLPSDLKRLARIVHLSDQDFLKIWEFLHKKFEQKDGKFFNKKLETVKTERSEHSSMRRIIGIFGRLIRDLQASDVEKYKIRKQFNYNDFVRTPEQNLSKTLADWVANAHAKHEDANEIEDEDEIEDGNVDRIGGVGERKEVVYDAEKVILENQIQFQRICAVTHRTEHEARDSLRKYHLFLQEKEQYPKGRQAVIAGFEKWLLNEKKITNGAKSNSTKVTGQQLNSSFNEFYTKGK